MGNLAFSSYFSINNDDDEIDGAVFAATTTNKQQNQQVEKSIYYIHVYPRSSIVKERKHVFLMRNLLK